MSATTIAAGSATDIFQGTFDSTTDGFLGIPTAALGRDYIVQGYGNVHTGVPRLNGTQFGFFANHSLVMANYISRANAAIIDLRKLLQEG